MNDLAEDDPQHQMTKAWIDSHLKPLRDLARSIFFDRNAQGMPERDREKINAAARPHLRQAIAHVRKSRNAFRKNDIAVCECERDRARMYWAFARIEFFRPYANQVGKRDRQLAKASERGATATAEKFSNPELDRLIRGCLNRNEPMRVEAWVEDGYAKRSTIYEHIKRIKKELIK